jgi:isopenicillin N synthase-like dioxygenase
VPEGASIDAFLRALHEYWAVVAGVADATLRGVARALSADSSIAFAGASYIEINSYFRTDERSLLQDRHEDGHLLTILTSDGPGLEIERGDTWEAIGFGAGELGIMPGSLLTDMTGGRIPPLFHQVRNHHLPSRQSILFLVNPPLDGPIEPWLVTDANRGINIAERARSNGQSFGLPEAPVLAGDTPSARAPR